jgi:hypothetical protein
MAAGGSGSIPAGACPAAAKASAGHAACGTFFELTLRAGRIALRADMLRAANEIYSDGYSNRITGASLAQASKGIASHQVTSEPSSQFPREWETS